MLFTHFNPYFSHFNVHFKQKYVYKEDMTEFWNWYGVLVSKCFPSMFRKISYKVIEPGATPNVNIPVNMINLSSNWRLLSGKLILFSVLHNVANNGRTKVPGKSFEALLFVRNHIGSVKCTSRGKWDSRDSSALTLGDNKLVSFRLNSKMRLIWGKLECFVLFFSLHAILHSFKAYSHGRIATVIFFIATNR